MRSVGYVPGHDLAEGKWILDSHTDTILSNLLRKRLKNLGYPSLRKFHADRPGLGLSYEALRQVVYQAHIPRPETMFRILRSMRFSSGQIRKICGMHYGDYLPISSPVDDIPGPAAAAESEGGPRETTGDGPANPSADGPRPEGDMPPSVVLDDPEETVSRLLAALPAIPIPGNEDFWEMVEGLTKIAEKKARSASSRQTEQPLLFAGEPEAIYQFLVRSQRIPPFLSRGENLVFGFVDGIDYRDRYRGAMLGSAVGEALGSLTQGLTPRDVRELYGEVDALPVAGSVRWSVSTHGFLPLAVALALLPDGVLDPPRMADAIARSGRRDDPPGLSGFARNLIERGLPWHEAGESAPESMPAVAVLPLALLRAGNFRRLKLEAGILTAISHTHPSAIAGAIAQACAVVRTLHSPAGSIDVISFSRALSPVVSGIEPERGARPRIGRSATTVGRKLGAELPALLLRRAPVQEMQEALGNGTAAHEGIPFALGCFLRSPGEFAEAVLPAVRHGGDARAAAALAGALCGAYVGESGIPERFLERLPHRGEIAAAADGLLALARREG